MGGVTTSIGMPNVKPPVNSVALYRGLVAVYERDAYVDFNLNVLPLLSEQVPGLAAAGALGFKIWMVEDSKRDYPHMPGLGVHADDQLLEVFEAVAETRLPLMVHPHNQALMNLAEQRAWRSSDRGPVAYARAQRFYDGLVWDTAIQTLLRMQQAVGTRLHVLHLVTTRSVDMVRGAKATGADVTAEVNPFALFLGDLDLIEKRGPYVLGRWLPSDVKDALWTGLRDGTIDVIGTDHAPHTVEEKERGWLDAWESPSGTPQLQDYFSKLLSNGVHANRISLDQAARVAAYNPARIFGLYPRKGTIEIGSDADLVVADLDAQRQISNAEAVSKCGWTPYDGDTVRGMPTHTVVRGAVVMRDRQIVGSRGWGRRAVRCDASNLNSTRKAELDVRD